MHIYAYVIYKYKELYHPWGVLESIPHGYRTTIVVLMMRFFVLVFFFIDKNDS